MRLESRNQCLIFSLMNVVTLVICRLTKDNMQCSTNLFIGKTRPLNQCCNFDIIFILHRSICNASFNWVRSGKVLICFASRCQYPAVLELCNSFYINIILNLNFLPCYTGEVNGAASVDVHLPAPYNLSLWLHHGQVDVVPYGGRRRHLTLVDTSITEIRKKKLITMRKI